MARLAKRLGPEKAQSLTNPSSRLEAIQSVLNRVMQSDPDAASEMLDALSDSAVFADVSGFISLELARKDAQRALDFANAHSIDHPDLLGDVISNIAQYEPDRALELSEPI